MYVWLIYFFSCMTKLQDSLIQLAQMRGNKKLCKHVVRITVDFHLPM